MDLAHQEKNKIYYIEEELYHNAKPIEYIIDDNDCWLVIYPTSTNKGYPIIIRKGVKYRGNRYSYTKFKGEIPEGMHVMHICDNPSCINPEHLELGTHQDNMDDAKSKGRHKMPESAKKTLSNINKKFTNKQVLEVKKMLLNKYTHQKISDITGMSKSTIRRIKQGKSAYS